MVSLFYIKCLASARRGRAADLRVIFTKCLYIPFWEEVLCCKSFGECLWIARDSVSLPLEKNGYLFLSRFDYVGENR